MIIIWGTKARQTTLGCVVDDCPICKIPTICVIINVETVPHLYYISLGGWHVESCHKICTVCQVDSPGDSSRYRDFVPIDELGQMSFDTLAMKTNPVLAIDLDNTRESTSNREALPSASTPRANYEIYSQENTGTLQPLTNDSAHLGTDAAPAIDARLAALDQRLVGYEEATVRFNQIIAKLNLWSCLTAAQRNELEREVETYVQERERLRDAEPILRKVAAEKPYQISYLLPILTALGVMVCLPFLPGVAWILIGLLVGVVVVLFAVGIAWSNARQAWLKQWLIPRMAEHGVNLAILHLALVRLTEQDAEESPALRKLVSDRNQLLLTLEKEIAAATRS